LLHIKKRINKEVFENKQKTKATGLEDFIGFSQYQKGEKCSICKVTILCTEFVLI